MRVQFVERQNGPDKLITEAEIIFDEGGPLDGLKIVGLSLWRTGSDEINVTFPARSFGSGGERRFFDYIRTVDGGNGAARRLKSWIVDEYRRACRGDR